jgi:hypothetical protein
MIAFKLFQLRRQLRAYEREVSKVEHNRLYISFAGVLVETAALYTITTITYVPMLRSNAAAAVWWGQVVQSLAVSCHSMN